MKKIFPIFLSLFLFLTIFLTLSLLRQRQEIRKEAAFNGKLGAFFFTWYNCPGGISCDTNKMPFIPPGITSPYPNDGYYGSQNQEWFNREISDAQCAHLDILAVDIPLHSLITNPTPTWLSRLANALKNYGRNVQIALFMDTNPIFVSSTEKDLCDATNQAKYTQAINAFYTAIPSVNRSYYLMTFIADAYKNTMGCATQFWTAVKQSTGKTLLHDYTWGGGSGADALIAYGPRDCISYIDTGLSPMVLVRPGADHSSQGITCYVPRTSGAGFQNVLNQVPAVTQLTLIESWNELYEGTMVGRGIGFSPQTAYIDAIRRAKGFSGSCLNDYTSPSPTPSSTPGMTLTPSPTPSLASLNFKIKFEGFSSNSNPSRVSTIRVIFKDPLTGTVKYTFEGTSAIPVSGNTSGVYSGLISNVDPGTYDIYFKENTHLQRKFAGVVLVSGTNPQDWSTSPSWLLLAGDANNDNRIDSGDFGVMVPDYLNPATQGTSRADFNYDSRVDSTDFGILSGNYSKVGD